MLELNRFENYRIQLNKSKVKNVLYFDLNCCENFITICCIHSITQKNIYFYLKKNKNYIF